MHARVSFVSIDGRGGVPYSKLEAKFKLKPKPPSPAIRKCQPHVALNLCPYNFRHSDGPTTPPTSSQFTMHKNWTYNRYILVGMKQEFVFFTF